MPYSGDQIPGTVIIEQGLIAVVRVAEDLGVSFNVGSEYMDVEPGKVANVLFQDLRTSVNKFLIAKDETSALSGTECEFILLDAGEGAEPRSSDFCPY